MKYKLLIVDDEKLIREGLAGYLDWEALGITLVGTAFDAASAFTMAEKTRPDIILSDIRMPDMDGTQMLQCLREKGFSCAVIFMSAYSDFKYAQTAIQYSAFDYLLKPITQEDLSSCVARCVKKLDEQDMGAHTPTQLDLLQGELAMLYKNPGNESASFLDAFRTAAGCAYTQHPKTLLVAVQLKYALRDMTPLLDTFEPAAVVKTHVYANVDAYLICAGHPGKQAAQAYAYSHAGAFPNTLFYIQPLEDLTLHDAFSLALYHVLSDTMPTDVSLCPIGVQDYFTYVHTALSACFFHVNPCLIDQLLYSFLAYQNRLRTLWNTEKFVQQCLSLIYMAYNMIRENYASLFDVSEVLLQDLPEKIGAADNATTAFFELYNGLYDIITQVNARSGKNKIARQALCYIHENYASTNLSLLRLAKHLSVSPPYLSKLFKENYQTSFSDYLFAHRMHIATKRLCEGSRVCEVALSVGYQDVAQFSKMFKKKFGCSPRQWAKST